MSNMRRLIGLMKKASSFMYTSFNPSDRGSNVVLTNGNLTADGQVAHQQVRAGLSKSSGKWYWEVRMDSGTNGLVGIASLGATLNSATGSEAASIGYRASTGQVLQGGSVLGTVTPYAPGTVIGLAFDAGAATLSIYNNNAFQGTLSTSSAGAALFPTVGWGLGGLCSFTANFGATAFTYSPPSGYAAGLYT